MKANHKPVTFNPIFILSRVDYAFLLTLITTLVLISRVNYLAFHSLVEVAIMTTSFLSFAFTWHLRRFNLGPLLPIGIVLGCSAIISIFHMLSYLGMGVFAPNANFPTQFWIASRYLLSVVILVSLLFPNISKKPGRLISILLLITVVLISLVFLGWFPDCYIHGEGLQPFKIVSEYIISALLVISMAIFWNKRGFFSERVTWLVLYFFTFSILTNLAFVSYFSIFDFTNMIGHLLQLCAAFFLYKAVVESGLINPFELMFKNLNEAVNTRDEFISIASHELKTPLTPIKLHLQMLQREIENGKFDPKTSKSIRSANELFNKLNQLIDGMLDVSRLSTGRFEVFKEKTDLTLLLNNLAKNFESQILAAHSTLVLKLENVELEVDPLRIEQVVNNLISNAIKYAPSSTIEIGLKKNSNTVALWVKDSGPGISKEFQQKIFNRYEREKSLVAVGGLGLGLYISRQIIEAHGGEITLESELGHGSKFCIIFNN